MSVLIKLIAISIITIAALNPAAGFIVFAQDVNGFLTEGEPNPALTLLPDAAPCSEYRPAPGKFVALRFGNCTLTDKVSFVGQKECAFSSDGLLQLTFVPSTAMSSYHVEFHVNSLTSNSISRLPMLSYPAVEAGKEYHLNIRWMVAPNTPEDTDMDIEAHIFNYDKRQDELCVVASLLYG